jgi:mono/diheme cytochrome c family protein
LYNLFLLLHSYTRWLVVVAMLWALWQAWNGLIRKRAWTKWDNRAGLFFATIMSVQFFVGLVVYLQPEGLAQAGVRDLAAAMKVRELRFFSVEHPLQMFIALFLAHLGRARSRKATAPPLKHRWATVCYTLATVAILLAIPWWRPLVRAFDSASVTPPIATAANAPQGTPFTVSASTGDPARGEALFKQNIGGQPACSTCHTLKSKRLVGPGLAGIASRAGARVAGQTAAEYLHVSIIQPNAYLVPEYPSSLMPGTYASLLSPQQIDDVVAYLLTIK